MDLKLYYQKLRQAESNISDAHVVVVSQETPDGGRAGVRTEVPKHVAARMLVEGKIRLATPEEAAAFHEEAAEAKRTADQTAAASRVQFTIVSESDLRAVRKGPVTKGQ
jgi:hypothetical protein